MQVKITPYNSGSQQSIPVIPATVQSFIDGGFTASCSGYAIKVESDSRDTGHGMDYLNQLLVTKDDKVVYDSGMLLWRNGRPCSDDCYYNRFSQVGLKADGEKMLLGIKDGEGKILIHELQNSGRRLLEVSNVKEIEEAVAASKIQITDLNSFKGHFSKGKDHKWRFSSYSFDCVFGPTALVYHNGHTTDVVWDFIQLLVFHDGKPYVSNQIWTNLEWHGKFTDSTLVKRVIDGNCFEITLSSGYHKNSRAHPVTLKFELVLEPVVAVS